MKNKRIRNRVLYIIITMLLTTLGCYITLAKLKNTIIFYYPISEIHKIQLNKQNKVRIGGFIKQGSIIKSTEKNITFTLTDDKQELIVKYTGILPPLFRELQGIIAEGYLSSYNLFIAHTLLTKHDENYMP